MARPLTVTRPALASLLVVAALGRSAPAAAQPAPVAPLALPAPPPPPAYAPPAPPGPMLAPPVQAPPGYAGPYALPPGWQAWPASPAPTPPTELRYVPGQPIPGGYHHESLIRRGLVLAGAIVGGSMYAISFSVAANSAASEDGWLLVPVLGPFLDLGARGRRCTGECFDDAGARAALTLDGIVQLTGAALVLGGLFARREVLVRDDAALVQGRPAFASLQVAPTTLGHQGYGLAALGWF